MHDDVRLRATLTALGSLLGDTEAYVRGSAALRLLVPGAVDRAVRDVDLVCASGLAPLVINCLSSSGWYVQVAAKELVTEGVSVGQDVRFAPTGHRESELLSVDIVAVSAPRAPHYLSRLGVPLPEESIRVLDLAMLVVDKAKLLCPSAAPYTSDRSKDLRDLAAIAANASPQPEELRIAVEACSELWNWRDWSGFPVVPDSWASEVADVVVPEELLARVAGAAARVATHG